MPSSTEIPARLDLRRWRGTTKAGLDFALAEFEGELPEVWVTEEQARRLWARPETSIVMAPVGGSGYRDMECTYRGRPLTVRVVPLEDRPETAPVPTPP